MYSTGLIIFTNDGDFASKLSHPSAEIEKEYVVESSLPLPRDLAKKPFSADELARQTKFRQAIAAVNALTEEQKTAYATAFANQKKYASLRGYMFAQEYAKLS
jgi:16S rRNA U516 pseudouridylate synthase RsuA-like enzyme